MKLRQIAHSRTGDKGDISTISVIAYRAKDYATLRAAVDAATVRAFLESTLTRKSNASPLDVKRYELPRVYALNFVVTGALHGGVTRSLALDRHGKTLGSLLLDLDV